MDRLGVISIGEGDVGTSGVQGVSIKLDAGLVVFGDEIPRGH